MPELLKVSIVNLFSYLTQDFETVEGIRVDNVRALLETYLLRSSHLGPNITAQHHRYTTHNVASHPCRLSAAVEAINSRSDLDEYVVAHKPASPPPPRARYESHDGIIREITDSIGPDAVSPRTGSSKGKKPGLFGTAKKKPV
jgi:hypothetical protein